MQSSSKNERPVHCDQWDDVVAQFNEFPHSYDQWVATEDGVENLGARWIFRGQASDRWDLSSSYDRLALKCKVDDGDVIAEFRKKARRYMASSAPLESDYVGWLALMQHHGAPTRLLDFTYSPYVAAYFALREDTPTCDTAVVWALELNTLRSAIAGALTTLDDATKPNDLMKLRPDYVSVALRCNLESARLGNTGYVVPVVPEDEPIRMAMQQGLFLLNGTTLPFETSLRKMLGKNSRTAIRCIRLNRVMRLEALRRLHQMNVHELSLFPDLDGLAQYVRLKSQIFAEQAC